MHHCTQGEFTPLRTVTFRMQDMDATSSANLVHTQVHPRRPWRSQGPRPSVRGSKGRRRKKSLLLQQLDIRPCPGHPALPGHPAQPPKIRSPSQNASGGDPDSPDIRSRAPDIRLLPKPRTSGPPRRKSGPWYPESNRRATRPARTSGLPARTSGPSRSPRHPALEPGHPAPVCA